MSKAKYQNGKENVRQILAWVAAAFVDESQAVSVEIFHGDEIESPIPPGKAVRVTFELVDHLTCGTCGGDLPNDESTDKQAA